MWLEVLQIVTFFIIFVISRLFRLFVQKNHHVISATGGRKSAVRTMMILGSGGHTAEMMAIAEHLDRQKYTPRYYVLANSDTTSEAKVKDIELASDSDAMPADAHLIKIPRSRSVKQSYVTSVFTTIYSILYSVPTVVRVQPELILCNGPGTCVPICLIALFLQVFFINRKCKIVFVESYCRVKSLSLSGKMLFWFTDLFVVQWPKLQNQSQRLKYFGRLT